MQTSTPWRPSTSSLVLAGLSNRFPWEPQSDRHELGAALLERRKPRFAPNVASTRRVSPGSGTVAFILRVGTPLRPLVLIRGQHTAAQPVLAALEAGGWRIHPGLQLPFDPWAVLGVVCVASVAGQTDASLAVLAAARGAGLVVTVTGRDEVLERLVEDLSRIGPIEFWPKEESSPLRGLTTEHWSLLTLLAQGHTVTDAARDLHLSRRTADRRLADAREVLGVTSNAEAVLVLHASAGDSLPSWLQPHSGL